MATVTLPGHCGHCDHWVDARPNDDDRVGLNHEQFGFRRVGEVAEAAVPGLMVELMRAELG